MTHPHGHKAEQDALKARRAARGIDEHDPVIGLALSGGGIRSATFCLGLLRGLAQNKVLSRFDYLSTVSGGGFVGAMLGRLVQRVGIDEAQEQLAKGNSGTLQWLRAYGRYLTPRGARDYGVAIATYLRSAVAIHFELGMLALLAGVLIVLPHAIQLQWFLLDPLQWRHPWKSVWWPLAAAFWLLFAPGTMSAYWSLRDPTRVNSSGTHDDDPTATVGWVDVGTVAVLGLALSLLLFGSWQCASVFENCKPPVSLQIPLAAVGLRCALIIALLSMVGWGAITMMGVVQRRARPMRIVNAQQRQRLTNALRATNIITLALVLAGVLDLATWHIKEALGRGSLWLFGSIGLSSIVVAFGRSVLEPLQKLTERPDGPRLLSFRTIVNVIGIVVAVALMIGWVTLVQWITFPPAESAEVPTQGNFVLRALLIAAVPAAWILFTNGNRETTNASSLHIFYRGRLSRAYLRVGNRDFADDDPIKSCDVTSVAEQDDIPLYDYNPETRGGPIHLITTCINQTRSQRGGIYNADRKGARLTASRHGLELGNRTLPARARAALGSLGQWVAISGAAGAPGAGSYTSLGWALLLFMTGIRLGYWFPSGLPRADNAMERANLWMRDSKFGRLYSEAMARFHGEEGNAWYLSDGGHFDNTGVHALLKRKADFILLADCGADPKFQLGDLENLIRKARIDYDAEIEFYAQDANPRFFPGAWNQSLRVLAPEDLSSNFSARGVLLGRITYRSAGVDPSHWRLGTLLVVKPNLHEVLDPDILAYARRNADFPQQSTGDQFFDEAQWESYHRLGEDFGRAMTSAWLSHLPGWSRRIAPADSYEPLRTPRRESKRVEPEKPFWRTDTKVAALGATLGLGAIGALLLPVWQGVDRFVEARETRAAKEKEAFEQAMKLAPRWAQEGRLPQSTEEKFQKTYVARPSVAQLYQQVSDRLWSDSATDPSVMLIRTLQDGCDLERPAEHLRMVCPPTTKEKEMLPDLCTAVCDPREENNSYWPSVREVVVSGNAAIEDVERDPEWTGSEVDADALVQGIAAMAPPPAIQAPPSSATIASPPPPPPASSTTMATQVQDPPATAATVAAVASAPVAESPDYCKDKQLYVHVYDEATRTEVDHLQWSNLRSLTVHAVENVSATALARGSRPPYRWSQPTFILHRSEADKACAFALEAWLKPQIEGWYEPGTTVAIRKLPSRYAGQDATIELWFPGKLPAVDATQYQSAR